VLGQEDRHCSENRPHCCEVRNVDDEDDDDDDDDDDDNNNNIIIIFIIIMIGT
jgi:hypothetical protein